MADERDEDQFGENEGKAGQQPTGQQGQQKPAAEQGQQPMGQQPESGQQGQSSSGQAQPSGGSETMTGDPNSQDKSGQGGSQGEGFVGSKGGGSDEYLQERGGQLVDDATSGSDFAEKGQGAPEAEEDDTGGSSL